MSPTHLDRTKSNKRRAAAATLLLAAALAATGIAGPLSPPAGPVESTAKPLQEVEPRTGIRNDPNKIAPVVIDQPGSYYLLESISSLAGEDGIRITASDVTLDLNGFSVRGDTRNGSNVGIRLGTNDSPIRRIAVRNGSIARFLLEGIDGEFASDVLIEGIRVTNCRTGIEVRNSAQVTRCTANDNSVNGIQVSFGSTATECTARGNGADGIQAFRSIVTGSTATDNSRGFFLSEAAATNCVAVGNTSVGINATSNSLVNACSAIGSVININDSFDSEVFNSNQ